jgi:BirA family transcriptional regulator, biotin operon repressor / biotin---[acetyl-CoA-carboxylase] ligase
METLFIGKNAIFLPETESTNSHAIGLLKNVNLPDGTLVHARRQTAGKGQRGARWESDADNSLCVSFVLKPLFLDLRKQHCLYQVSSLAVADALAEFMDSREIQIKWPNDVLVNGRKIAGILIENQVTGRALSWSVIGVGVNLNHEEFQGLPRAVSLRQVTGRSFSYEEVLERIASHLEKYYLLLRGGDIATISKRYRQRLYGLRTRREFIYNQARVHLTITGVSRKGLLSLEDESGTKIEADVKQVEWIF